MIVQIFAFGVLEQFIIENVKTAKRKKKKDIMKRLTNKKRKERMSKATDDFWNELAITQMAGGVAPSVKTESMQKALSGDKDEARKIESEIDVNKAVMSGLLGRTRGVC